MDIGVLPVLLDDQLPDEMLEYRSGFAVGTVELGCSGNPGHDHLSRMDISMTKPQDELHDSLAEHDLRVSALATHNNSTDSDTYRRQRWP